MLLEKLVGIRFFYSKKKSLRCKIVNLLEFIPGKWSLFELAFIPRSASIFLENGQSVNNDRLEYLGDAVLDSIVAEYLFDIYPLADEGFLSKMRSKIVKRSHLNELALKMGIDQCIAQTAINSGGKHIFGNTFEALLGSIYLDKGYNRTRKYVIRIIRRNIHLEALEKHETDYKSRMIEWAQKNRVEISFDCQEEYLTSESQPAFVAKVIVQNNVLGTGIGHSKKEAEQSAAEQASSNLPDITNV